MKQCTKCLGIFQESDFYRDNSKKDRLNRECKTCSNKRTSDWNNRNRERKRSLVKKSYAKHREDHLRYKKEYYKLHKDDYYKEWREKTINNPEFVDVPQEWYFKAIKNGAKKRNLPFRLDFKTFQQSYGDGTCVLSGRKLKLTKTGQQATGNQTASLDRIDSSMGYELGNIQWVDVKINCSKSASTQEDFIQMCKEVASHN